MEAPRQIEEIALTTPPTPTESHRRARPGQSPPARRAGTNSGTPLADLAQDPERLGAILRAAEAIFQDIPPLRNALTAWLVLLAARKSHPPDPRNLAYGLWAQGWKLLEPTERPRAGDVFLLAGPDKRPTHVGVVAKVSTDGTWFTAIDDTIGSDGRPYRRSAVGPSREPIASFLRFG